MLYEEFIRSKMIFDHKQGFEVDKGKVNAILFEHQRDIVVWALSLGRAAIFAAFGLGKTYMQIEIMRQIAEREGGKQLIICPLGVRQEFIRDAEALDVSIRFARRDKELLEDGLYITNYESVRDGRLSPDNFTAVSLDEASVLRSYGSKTYQGFLSIFSSVRYRFVATATPSPNRYKELIHYAGFLGIMDTGQALTRFFQRDSTKANNLTLYPHKEREFWLWMASWAIFLQKPSDLGYSDEGYILPRLHVHWHSVETELEFTKEKSGQLNLFRDAALGVSEASAEKRRSIDDRIAEMLRIVASHPDEHLILWHDQEIERAAIKRAIPAAACVYGALDLETRERHIIDFSEGREQYLATKPILSGSGCNFQYHCRRAIFVGVGFKFNDFIQAVHRIYRFQQTRECHIHIIYTDTELRIVEILKEKWRRHEEMVANMTEIIKQYGLSTSAMAGEFGRAIGVERIEVTGQHYTMVNNDCVDECRNMSENSVDLIHTSIPFGNHYEYSANFNDFGHNENNQRFFEQMDFLVPELLRVLKPGRVAAIHVKDRIMFGNVTGHGFPTSDDFHMDTAACFKRHGFLSMGMVTVVTDVVRENNQTYRLGWTEQCKDATKMGVGMPEYILILRKPQTDSARAYADDPVVHRKEEYSRARWQVDAHGFWRSSGNRLLSTEEINGFGAEKIGQLFKRYQLDDLYDYETHVKIGERLDAAGLLPTSFMLLQPRSLHPMVWDDVARMRTLNSNQARKKLAYHVCPLQLDIVDRIIERYSNKDDLVLDPFAGLGTVPYRAILAGRRGHGIELNSAYFGDSLSYLEAAERMKSMPTLFDVEKIEMEVTV